MYSVLAIGTAELSKQTRRRELQLYNTHRRTPLVGVSYNTHTLQINTCATKPSTLNLMSTGSREVSQSGWAYCTGTYVQGGPQRTKFSSINVARPPKSLKHPQYSCIYKRGPINVQLYYLVSLITWVTELSRILLHL